MNTFEKLISSVSGVLGILALILPSLTLMQKIIALITIAFLCILSLYIKLIIVNKKLASDLKERTAKHAALAQQFDKKLETNRRYRTGFEQIGNLLNMSILSTDGEKLDKLYSAFLIIQDNTYNGGEQNAKDL